MKRNILALIIIAYLIFFRVKGGDTTDKENVLK